MESVLDYLKDFYLNFELQKGVIGKSHQGREIYYFLIEKTPYPKIIVQYSIHAREYITTYLAIEQIKDFIKRGKSGSVYFVPALNPDGIFISQTLNPLYKANARGVDLNVNFDARWGRGKQNVKIRGDANFIGDMPFSENESRAIRDFTLKIKPNLTVSYHAKGQEIYYDFYQSPTQRARDYLIAKQVADVTGYKIVENLPSSGGYKDWCIEKLKIPALTIEVGKDSLTHPINKAHLGEIFRENKDVIKVLTESVWTKNL